MIKRMIAAAAAALMLLTAIPSALARRGTAPSGFNAHDFAKLTAFLEQTDADGVKNGDKIAGDYSPSDPSTWGDVIKWDDAGRVCEIRTNFRQEPLAGPLDLSGCEGLTYLGCTYCELSRLDVSGCSALELIYCYGSKLEKIDVSGCGKLSYLNCSNNLIAELDISDCVKLETLACGVNRLTELDVSGLTRLSMLHCLNNPLVSINMKGTLLPIESVTAGEGGFVGVNQGEEQDTNAVHAFPNEGYSFDGWYDNAGRRISADKLLDFCFISDTGVTARFKPDFRTPEMTLSSVASTGKTRVSWDEVKSAAGYEVWRASSKNGEYIKMFTTTKLSYINTSAKAGERYYYKVRAFDANGGFSGFCAPKYRTCRLARPEVTGGHAASTGKNRLTWKPVPGAVGYEILRAKADEDGFTKVFCTTKTSYVNTAAAAGEKYRYKVVAVHSETVANSAASGIKTLTCDLPRPVVTIGLSGGKPKLVWDAVPGAVSYEIWRRPSCLDEYKLIKTTDKTAFINTNAEEDVKYYYKVAALHPVAAANSAYSVPVSIVSQ